MAMTELNDDETEPNGDETERDDEEPSVPTVLVPTRDGWKQVPEDTASHWSEMVWHDGLPPTRNRPFG